MSKDSNNPLETIALPKNIVDALKKLPQDKLADHILMENGFTLADREKIQDFIDKNKATSKDTTHRRLKFVY